MGELATYYVNLFIRSAMQIDASEAMVAHALWLLIEEVERRRRDCAS